MESRKGTTRRKVLGGMAGAAAIAATGGLRTAKSFAATPLKGTGSVVIQTGGGAWAEAQKIAYYDPFQEETGIEVIAAPQVPTGKIKASIMAGAPAYDVFEPSGAIAHYLAEDLLQPIDYQYFEPGDKEAFAPVPCLEYQVPSLYYSMLIAYDKKTLNGKLPETWGDMWDAANFPGKRSLCDVAFDVVYSCTFEIALLADGVPPEKLYPLDLERALKSLDRIKPSILKYWASGAEPVQLLVDKHVSIASAWNGRLTDIEAMNPDVGHTWNQGFLQWAGFVVPTGAENRENAMKFIAFASRPEQQAKFAEVITYGPTNARAYDHLSEERAKILPTGPAQRDLQIVQDAAWWDEDSGDGTTNQVKAAKLWQEWLMRG